MRVRKKPVVIEAWLASRMSQYAKGAWAMLPEQIVKHYDKGDVLFAGDGSVHIKSLEGWMRAEPDDMIICGVKGELYPCKPDIFAQTYEAEVQ